MRYSLIVRAVFGVGFMACSSGGGAGADLGAAVDSGGSAVVDLGSGDLRVADLAAPPPDLAAGKPDLGGSDMAVAREQVQATIVMLEMWANCQPAVPLDPVRLSADIAFSNPSAGFLGPITVSSGVIEDAMGKALASFDVGAVSTRMLGPGTFENISVTKSMGSLAPANGCNTIPCGSTIRVGFDYTGVGAQPGARVYSTPMTMECVY